MEFARTIVEVEMNVTCPRCRTSYRVDSRKVPPGGVRARCDECPEVFEVEPPVELASAASGGAATEAPPATAEQQEEPEGELAAVSEEEAPGIGAAEPGEEALEEPLGEPSPPPFGGRDPDARARRLARALVSDIVVYHPERRERSLREGTIRQEFRAEIRKSWEEYVAQVGNQMARETSYFRDALNELLAGGARVF